MADLGAWLGEQIEANSPEATDDPDAAVRLAQAAAALGGAVAPAFGMTLPDTIDNRDELKAKAVDALKRWLPKLDGDAKERLKKLIGEYQQKGQ